MRADNGGQTGGAVEVVLASIALVIAVVALVVALSRDSGSDKSAASTALTTTTTMSPQRVCQAKLAAFNRQWRVLDAQRVQLTTLEQQLNAKLTSELAAHSPNAGATDASHQAVLREQSDIQQRILSLQESRDQGPGSCSLDVTP